ncbi:polysaccharide biosynthesis/export family protein [Novosphingobium sp. RD2P27]|uniref:Polysaccharide biosynthesis/export family protein n=1 Tax=Novosphingobium kalidii TaxID=3230299 RepID=A0ABV2D4S3_9SPHN
MTALGIGRARALSAAVGISMMLAGCASLPSSGPTAQRILSQAAPDEGPVEFNVVALDEASVEALNASIAPGTSKSPRLGSLTDIPLGGLIGPGDTLQIDLYEVGVSLFSGPRATAAADPFDASAHGQEFPPLTVDADGYVRLPFAGRIRVGGMTTEQVAEAVEKQFASQSQFPQAVVTIEKSVFSSVVVAGDVRRPGRITLTWGKERLVDVVAAAGGTELPIDDVLVRFARGEGRAEQRLGDIAPGSVDDLVLNPGDRIEVVRAPRTFTVFGAPGAVSEVAFQSARLSLAEAIARVGGPSDAFADPTAIFLFRLDAPVGVNGRPNIYRISMLDVSTYFLTQKLAMKDDDLIYIASARSNQASKFVSILNQLFSPVITARAVAK